LQGLNSSLAQSAAELCLAKVCPKRANYAFSEKFGFRPKTFFLAHNFGYRYASKSIQGSIDADFDLVCNKTLSQKNGSIGWGPRPAKCGEISKTPPLVAITSANPPPKTKNVFFSISTRRLAEYVVFEQLSGSSGWRVMAKKVPATIVACAGRKGF